MFGNSVQSFFQDTPNWNYGAVLALWLVMVVFVMLLVCGRYLAADLQETRMNPAAGRVGKACSASYFVFMVIFLYMPLVVLVVFAFNDA